jgi:hypothetical protein
MAEYTNVALQTVADGQNVLFSETPVPCTRGIVTHREGSGIFRLRGAQCRARYKVSFGANLSIPTGGTPGDVSIALSIDGEPLGSATAIETLAAVGDFANVFVAAYIDVPCGCCATVSVENISDQDIDVQNANLIIERVA